MKRMWSLLAALLCLAGSGCLVQSLSPWLSPETAAEDRGLEGSWSTADGEQIASFVRTEDGSLTLTLLDDGHAGVLQATRHALGGQRFLDVTTKRPDGVKGFALVPAHLLVRCDREGDRLRLYAIDPRSFGARMEKAKLSAMPGGDPEEGYVLTSGTAGLETLVRRQATAADFFQQEPVYEFQRVPARAAAPAPAPGPAGGGAP